MLWFRQSKLNSGRQDFTALCTTAGKNLTAVSSSHSLPETVNLGTMTAAGLVGTLHGIHLLIITYAQQAKCPQQRIIIDDTIVSLPIITKI
jgi:hypothetical protein